ncbi:DUF302 domain-containing protein [Microlunatus sp. Gsoil 973]|jgi:uncharacterized protein (DUF302 family)|uniref:DUF302 domain-containing protein n=1 Tax=Microlunatus sp. Gsoil 973 TaxID=2672569 RepID=UPI0012B45E30|nr:DUF302 domain-containing protein [Microlunatus sp. Gsoil 973]QGN32824.1 DUF302 domain-containing protein [Microlunatus sp. Gsoil 973]
MTAPSGDRYTLTATLALPYSEAVEVVRGALSDQGFGVLTEIDLAATLKAKLGKEIAPQIILGACRPPLAYQALQADPSVAALLPCNVVVRALDAETSLVEAFDPQAMLSFSSEPALAEVAADAKERLRAVLSGLQTAQQVGSPDGQQES